MSMNAPSSRRQRSKLMWLALGAMILLTGLWYVANRKLHFVSDAVTQMSLGTPREQVNALIASEHLQVAGFDYPLGDTRQGRTLLVSHRGEYFSFVFDHAGPTGKLLQKQVTTTPQPPPLGSPGELDIP